METDRKKRNNHQEAQPRHTAERHKHACLHKVNTNRTIKLGGADVCVLKGSDL